MSAEVTQTMYRVTDEFGDRLVVIDDGDTVTVKIAREGRVLGLMVLDAADRDALANFLKGDAA